MLEANPQLIQIWVFFFFTFIKTACNSAFEEYYFVVVSAPKYRVRPVRVITGHLAALDV